MLPDTDLHWYVHYPHSAAGTRYVSLFVGTCMFSLSDATAFPAELVVQSVSQPQFESGSVRNSLHSELFPPPPPPPPSPRPKQAHTSVHRRARAHTHTCADASTHPLSLSLSHVYVCGEGCRARREGEDYDRERCTGDSLGGWGGGGGRRTVSNAEIEKNIYFVNNGLAPQLELVCVTVTEF